MDDAQVTDLIGQMTRRGLTVATAESLTEGAFSADRCAWRIPTSCAERRR